MFYTYLIKSKTRDWKYLGSTDNLRRRFLEHNLGRVKSTKFYLPFDLVYYEAYASYILTRKREIELKTQGQQKEMLLKRLEL